MSLRQLGKHDLIRVHLIWIYVTHPWMGRLDWRYVMRGLLKLPWRGDGLRRSYVLRCKRGGGRTHVLHDVLLLRLRVLCSQHGRMRAHRLAPPAQLLLQLCPMQQMLLLLLLLILNQLRIVLKSLRKVHSRSLYGVRGLLELRHGLRLLLLLVLLLAVYLYVLLLDVMLLLWRQLLLAALGWLLLQVTLSGWRRHLLLRRLLGQVWLRLLLLLLGLLLRAALQKGGHQLWVGLENMQHLLLLLG